MRKVDDGNGEEGECTMRMIDAEELIKTIKDHHYLLRHPTLNSTDYGMFTNGIIQAIEEQTTIDIAPVMHGRWEHTHTTDSLWNECWTCSICGIEDDGFISGNYNYCPNCGAKMD